MSMNFVIDVMGWVGAVALLVAFAAVSTRRLEGDSMVFQQLNIGGSVLLIVNTFYYGAYPSAVVNTVWIGIAFYAIMRAKKKVVEWGESK